MDPELLRRVRWGNLARAAAVLAIAAAVIAWPRLAPPEPELPAGAVEPAEVAEGSGVTRPAAEATPSGGRRRARDAAGLPRRAASRSRVARRRGARRSGAVRGDAARPHSPSRHVAERRLLDAPPEPLDVPEVAAASAPAYRPPLPEFGAE